MADAKDDEPQEEDLPVAEPEDNPSDEQKGDGDAKEEEKAPMFPRIPKDDPGEYYWDKFADKKDPRGDPDEIEFKWDKNVRDKKDCTTIQMFYLIQIACDLHRRRVVERNKYFASISRTDRYIDHVDTPQIITNFLKWHNENKEKNIMLGEYLNSKPKLYFINEMINEIGGVKKGPATRIYSKLKKEVMVDHDQWTQSSTKLKLKTWGMKKLYSAEKVLAECTVEEVVTLFTFVPAAEEKKDDDEVQLNGVLNHFEGSAQNKNRDRVMAVDGWKEKIVDWIRKETIDGPKITGTAVKNLTPGMRAVLIPDTEINEKGKKTNTALNGPCGKMLNYCKKMPVHKVLEAAAAAAAAEQK